MSSQNYQKFCELDEELNKFHNRILTNDEKRDYVELFLEFSRLYDLINIKGEENEDIELLKLY